MFDLLEVNGVISAGFAAGGRWRTGFRPDVRLKLLTVARGGVRVSADGADAQVMSVGDSRTVFAERFATVVGKPPLAYLTGWRMYAARRALRDEDVRVDELAMRLGYSTASAFSTAFRREVGESPRAYRTRFTGHEAVPAAG
ncbi:AraC family transcriptional regulator [Streptomyces sp. NPDC004592]